MAAETPRILLDTNILVANFRPSNAFKRLLEGSRSRQIDLIVPELVLREAAQKHREMLTERVLALDKAGAKLRQLGIAEAPSWHPDPEAVSAGHHAQLRKVLKDAGARLVDLPSVGHEEVVARVLARRKPFKADDSGYRDALIWETVLEEATDGPITLCSGNTRDFGSTTESGEYELADDLVEDLAARGLASDSVLLETSLADYVERHIDAEAVALEEVRRVLPSLSMSLKDELEAELIAHEFPDSELANVEVSFGPLGSVRGVVDARVLNIEAPMLHIEQALLIEGSDVGVTIYAEVDAELELEVHAPGTSNLEYEYIYEVRTLGVHIEGTYDRSMEDLTAVQVIAVEVV
jgi:predicted nucleic acid-binding protein